jgi:pyruvate dehydrogenase E2 component (dihydrolipoamide acetyltransferase)
MRGTIARRMHESLQTMAQLTLTMDVDVDRLVALRAQLGDDWAADTERRVPSYTDFVVKATALALREHPRLNARVTEQAVEVLADVHVGLAVALDAGLVVPVIRHTDELSLSEVALETSRLSSAARLGDLTLDDLEGGTFSVTTLGSYGVDIFTPIVNPPNVAILGVGRVRDDVGWEGEQPQRVRRLTLSLTFDHRAVDGAPAAAFLATVRDALEHPARLLA